MMAFCMVLILDTLLEVAKGERLVSLAWKARPKLVPKVNYVLGKRTALVPKERTSNPWLSS